MYNIYSVYQLNQYFNNLWTWFPFRWQSSQLSWEYTLSNSKIKNYLTLSSSIKVVFITVILLALSAATKYPGLFLLFHLSSYWVQLFVLLILFAMDYVAYNDGESVAYCCNWVHSVERFKNITKREHKIISYIALGFVTQLAILTYLGACVLFILDLDPVYTATKTLFYICAESNQLPNSTSFTIFRLIICIYITHVVFVSPRTLSLLTFSEALHRLFLLKSLQKNNILSRNSIRFYHQSYIILSTVRPIDYKMTNISLVSILTGFILFSNVLVIGIKKNSAVLIILSGSIIIILSVSLNVLFFIGCYFYKTSSRIIRDWKTLAFKDKIVKRVVSSLRIIAMPAGEAGIIDVDIKINYLEKLLTTVVDSIITVESIFQL